MTTPVTTPSDGDADYFAHTRQAETNRLEKARGIARHLYQQSIDADTAAALPDVERRAAVRAAGHDRASDTTWNLVIDLLRARAAWDAAHPPPPPVPVVQPDYGTPEFGAWVHQRSLRPCVYRSAGCTGQGVPRGGHGALCDKHDHVGQRLRAESAARN